MIAILASISIVAYNGIQQRANNTARIANARNAVALLTLYTAQYNKQPANGVTYSCIGDGFANSNNDCGLTNATGVINRNASFNTELQNLSSLPRNSTPTVRIVEGANTWTALGPAYTYRTGNTVDGQANPLIVMYFLDGVNQDCGLPGIVKPVTTPNYPSGATGTPQAYTTVSASPRNSNGSLSTAGTVCLVAIP